MKLISFFSLILFSFSCASIQDASQPTPEPDMSGLPALSPSVESTLATSNNQCCWSMPAAGILNEKAKVLPEPIYPPAARTAKLAGKVEVDVLVDETGKVDKAVARTGNRLLRKAAVQAARQAEFSPMEFRGKLTKFTGVLIYEFRP